jgi:hypothetical protein
MASASEFDGDLTELPERMLFGGEEYGAIFHLPSDKGAFFKVYSCSSLATCTKNEGH